MPFWKRHSAASRENCNEGRCQLRQLPSGQLPPSGDRGACRTKSVVHLFGNVPDYGQPQGVCGRNVPQYKVATSRITMKAEGKFQLISPNSPLRRNLLGRFLQSSSSVMYIRMRRARVMLT